MEKTGGSMAFRGGFGNRLEESPEKKKKNYSEMDDREAFQFY
jgi:hypothetical protein